MGVGKEQASNCKLTGCRKGYGHGKRERDGVCVRWSYRLIRPTHRRLLMISIFWDNGQLVIVLGM